MTYKCKICGGQTTVDSQNGIVICEYCGTKQALPLFTEESERLLYDRGNNYLLHSEYDKAENVFNQLLAIKPGAAELYWDLVLCKYGVTYVKDPKTEKYIPTCNRTHYTPIFSDENYKKAIELSSGEKKALFEDDAKTIDNIQKGIITISKKEKPFDIFICYKETDANGNRTKDSVEAQKLYEKLTEAGYKVFFSRITLEDKIGAEYEPYIYAALYSSKVMITVSSSKENIEAVWVKNEWSRFLEFRQNDDSKTLLPLFFNMNKEELPDEFSLFSAYDMSSDGFTEELLRGIKKLIPLPVMKAKQRKKTIKIIGISAACICAVAMVLTTLFLLKDTKEHNQQVPNHAIQSENNEAYDAAMQLYYDGKYAEATWALEKLGNYKDAAQQAEKAKLSWRKSLANVITNNYYDNYYISANGAVVNSNTGFDHDDIKINEHGKIVSIANGYSEIIAMHEDGYVDNVTISDDIQWNDVVQITPSFTNKNAILLSNGKVVLGTTEYYSYYDDPYYDDPYYDDPWLEDVANWKNIVMLDSYVCNDEGVLIYNLVGLDKDGNVHSCYISNDGVYMDGDNYVYDDSITDTKERIEKLKNIKYVYCLSDDVIGLTNDGKYVSSSDRFKTPDSDLNNAIDIIVHDDDYYMYADNFSFDFLAADGKIYDTKSGNAILSDVVKIIDHYAITRSGTIYYYSNDSFGPSTNPLAYNAIIYDEWLARMD